MTTAKITITIEGEILTRLDLLVKSHIFPNRSVSDCVKMYEKRQFENVAVLDAFHGTFCALGKHDPSLLLGLKNMKN